MGQGERPRPKRLPRKLRQIRDALGLSQNGMVDSLGLRDTISRERVSAYEQGDREPSPSSATSICPSRRHLDGCSG